MSQNNFLSLRNEGSTRNKEIKNSLRIMLWFVVVWFIGSIIFSLLGLFNQPDQPPIFFGLFLAGPILVFWGAYALSKKVQEALFALPLWAITATHGLRLVGIAFVVAASRGELAPAFGWIGGGGDIISAVVSIPLAISLYQKRYSGNLRLRFIVWNIFGIIGLFLSVTLGLLYSPSGVGILSSPISNTRALSFLPYSLIPTFYVPILILLHILALRRSGEITQSSLGLEPT
jgi:hypothetical protein